MRRRISYECTQCEKVINLERDGECQHGMDGQGRSTKLVNTEFKPFYSEETKTMITSSRQMERVYKQHGLRPMGDAPFRKKMEYIQKHKGEYIQEKYAKEGIKYNPTENTRWSDYQKRLIPAHQWMREKAMGR